MSITSLLEQMLILVLIMAAGAAARRTGVITAEGSKSITRMLLDVTQPAMILASASGSTLELDVLDTLELFVCGCAMYAVLFAVAWLASPLFGAQRERRGICRFLTVFGNVGFMGFPVVSALYGPDAVVIAAIYLIPFNLLAFSVGVHMITGGGGVDKKALLTPALLASVAALVMLFFHIRLPYVLHEACETLGSMTVPGAMLVIGVTLGGASLKSVFSDKHVYGVCLARLIAAPLSVWLLCRMVLLPLFAVDDALILMLVVLSAMPAAATATMLCVGHGRDSRLASNGVFLTTVLSIVTVPVMISLLL